MGKVSKVPWHFHLLHLPQVSITRAALSAPLLAFLLATHTERSPPMPACSTELPPSLGYGGHTHTWGSWRSTYSPFLLARRARLQQGFVLLLHLREQTKKSLAGQGRGTQREKHRRQASHRSLSLKGRAPARSGILGLRTWATDILGSELPVTTLRMKSLCGSECQVRLPPLTSHVTH